jgi:four helix bundle protein
MKNNILKTKSFDFAVRIVNLYKFLKQEHNEFIISQQLIRSGTSIGALIREAEHAESTKDFVHKLNIGLKEANEAEYWLDLLLATDFITKPMHDSLSADCVELLKMLTSSVKTTRSKLGTT